MRIQLLSVLIVLLCSGLLFTTGLDPAQGEDEMEGRRESPFLQLGPATVLASPGAPGALDSFLPGAKRPEKLAWPLPKGPVVVLGLPHQDAIAQQIADAFHIDTEDLNGGYRIAAWRTKTRPIVLLMAADPAALHAARFEFDVDAPMEMMAPGMRSLDFKRPNQEAGFAVRRGTRLVQPRYRIRGFDVRERGQMVWPYLVATAAGARANRLWLSLKDFAAPEIAKTLAFARRHGVTPVAVAHAMYTSRCGEPVYRKALADRLCAIRDRHGVQHFVLPFRNPPRAPLLHAGKAEARATHALADALRPGGLAELTVIPSAHSDRLTNASGPPPDLRRIPEAVIGWSGPTTYALGITRAQAERRVEEAGIPVVLIDRWAAPFQDPTVPYVPSLPRGRAEDLHDVLDGVIVIGWRGTEAMLESLWAPVEAPRFGRSLLEPLCMPVIGEASWLAALATGLGALDKENLGLVPWVAPLKREVEAIRPLVRQATFLELSRTRGARMTLDGELLEPLWSQPALVRTEDDVAVHVALAGGALHIAVRVPKAALAARELLLRISLRRPGAPRGLRAELTPQGWRFDGGLRGAAPAAGSAAGAIRTADGALTAEAVLGRFALGGDLHCGRAFEVSIAWGPRRLWPKKAEYGAFFVGAGRKKSDASK